MLFYLQREVTLPTGTSESINIVLGAIDPRDNVTARMISSITTDADVLQVLSSEGLIKIASLREGLLYAILQEAVLPDKCINISTVYSTVSKALSNGGTTTLSSAQTKYLLDILKTQAGLEDEIAACIIYLVIEFYNYEKSGTVEGPVNIGPAMFDRRFFVPTQALISDLNVSVAWPFSEITAADNKTVFQSTCIDELFIEFPNRNALLNEDTTPAAYLPKLADLCNPYGSYNIEDISQYKDDIRFPESMYPMVEGISEQNTVEIYDNERKYYKCLIEWVQFNMKSSTVNEIDVSLSNPNIDRASQIYLEELAKLLYTKHWYHNLNIPIFDEFNELDDLIASDNVMSDYVFRTTAVEKDAIKSGIKDFSTSGSSRTNALEELIRYLKEASLTVGYGAYIQAIIQLARWGNRKPTCIIIDGYSLVFRLGDNKIKPYMGKISNYRLRSENGCDTVACAPLYDDVNFKDRKYLGTLNYFGNRITAPVGITTTKTLENTTDQGPKEITSYVIYSLIDVVNSYVAGDNKIKISGISYNGSEFIADENLALDQRNTYFDMKRNIKEEDNLERPFKPSQDLEDLIMDLDIQSAKVLTHFDILDSFASKEDLEQFISINAFSSKDDLNAKIQSRKIRNRLGAFIYSYGEKLTKIYVKVSLKLNELSEQRTVTFTDVLNVYKDVLQKCTLNIFTDVNNVANAPVQKMNVFGAETNTAEIIGQVASSQESVVEQNVQTQVSITTSTPTQVTNDTVITDEKRFTFIKEPKADAQYVKLLDKNGECVGGYAVEQRTLQVKGGSKDVMIFVLVDKPQIEQIPSAKIINSKPINSISVRLLFNLYHYETNDENRIVLYFNNLACMRYYVNLFNALSKEGKL